ncbi:MAG: diguanylate cyclase [Desulfobacterales bacterium]|nr:diguanylate cyclase [Desulfobacterales bacterium]MCP4162871.1 diguanylate cyclase [Deltaproteobacteria bacterium]
MIGHNIKETLESINILVVDDRPENIVALEAILENPDINIIKATSGEEALRMVLLHNIGLILLDVQMPGMDGFETAEMIRSNNDTKQIPIIFVTAINKEARHIFKGYESGAVDYIFKPLDPHSLNSKVRVFVELHRQKSNVTKAYKKINEANKKILSQQKSLVEQERLKVVLQMAGAAAHELNQPLMLLLGHVDLLEMDNYEPDTLKESIPQIKMAAQKLSNTVKKIQDMDKYKTKNYNETTYILNINNQIRILALEDSDSDFNNISSIIQTTSNMILSREKSISSALKKLDKDNFDIILMDYSLPDGTGHDFLKGLENQNISTPIVCITGYGNENLAASLLRDGVDDYLSKSELNENLLFRTIKNVLEKYQLKQDMYKAMKKMASLAIRDELTSLFNRRHMEDIMEQELSRARRYKFDLSCILFDLDFFKKINDTYGHACGDAVLTEFAARLRQQKRDSDFAFRYGGEEFLLLLPNTNTKGAQNLAENIRCIMHETPFKYNTNSLTVCVSGGIASFKDSKPETCQSFVDFADQALYQAKESGRNCIKVYQGKSDDITASITNKSEHKGADYFEEQFPKTIMSNRKELMKSLESLSRRISDPRFENEADRIKEYSSLLCKKYGLPERVVTSIKNAASLYNWFKTLLGEEILLKKKDLSKKANIKIKKLPLMQFQDKDLLDFFSEEKKIVGAIRENHDGTGYPKGKKADEIPLVSKILSISEVLVAMTSDRPHRKKLTNEQAVLELARQAGSHYDPEIVMTLLELISDKNLLDIPLLKIDNAKKIVAERIAKVPLSI